MELSLKPKVFRLIENELRSGKYALADEVVQAGMAALKQQQSFGDFLAGTRSTDPPRRAQHQTGGGTMRARKCSPIFAVEAKAAVERGKPDEADHLCGAGQRDVQQAWEYIAADNVNAADKLSDQIQHALSLLGECRHRPHATRRSQPPLSFLDGAALRHRVSLFLADSDGGARAAWGTGLPGGAAVMDHAR